MEMEMIRNLMYKAVSVIILTTLLSACGLFARTTPLPDCDASLEQLLLEEDDFPPDWQKGRAHQDAQLSGGAMNSCVVSFYILNGGAHQDIYEYEDEDKASSGYSSYLDAYAWKTADIVSVPTFASTIVEDHYLACAIPRDHQFCMFVGKYKNLVVVFTSYIGPSFLTQDDFVSLLSVIDEKMSSIEIR
jgi:hypothetical protein